MGRATCRMEISDPNDDGSGLIGRGGQKSGDILGKVLTVGIDRDGVGKPQFTGPDQSSTQCSTLPEIAFQPHHCAVRQGRQRIRRTVINNNDGAIVPRLARHGGNRRGMVEAGDDNATLDITH